MEKLTRRAALAAVPAIAAATAVAANPKSAGLSPEFARLKAEREREHAIGHRFSKLSNDAHERYHADREARGIKRPDYPAPPEVLPYKITRLGPEGNRMMIDMIDEPNPEYPAWAKAKAEFDAIADSHPDLLECKRAEGLAGEHWDRAHSLLREILETDPVTIADATLQVTLYAKFVGQGNDADWGIAFLSRLPDHMSRLATATT